MDTMSCFDVQTQGPLFDFDSFLVPENMEVLFWNNNSSQDERNSNSNSNNNSNKTEDSLVLKDNDNSDNKNNNNNKLGKRKSAETKNVAALKSHCEAERRRRERINGHLANLRNFVSSTDHKMDKATLLAEVITQVKELKSQALEATKGLLVPTDTDEVVVVSDINTDLGSNDNVFQFKLSVCSEYKPDIIPSLRRSINDLKLTIVKAEISTLGNRVKNVFTVSGKKNEVGYSKKEKFGKAIHKAMSCVLEKMSALEEFSPLAIYPSKRIRRTSYLLDSSISSPSL